MGNEQSEPIGPAGLRWTYLRSYGSGEKYSVDLHRAHDGTDIVNFTAAAEGVPEGAVGEYVMHLDREGLHKLIGELLHLRDHWGEVGRD